MALPMVRALSLAAVAVLLGAGTSRPPQPSAHHAACPAVDSSRFALDPHCAALHPTPDLPAAGGILELRPTPSPFGVTVTADGRPRHRLLATIRGLPLPATVDPRARHYVAWATNLAMDTTVRLGDVSNGENDLGEVNLEQFRVFVSAERASDAAERGGRLVLRGTSPDVRLLAHRDLVQPASPGAVRDDAPARAPQHARHAAPASGADVEWPMAPMPAWMRPMPPSMHVAPDVLPFRPASTLDPMSVPLVQPRRLVRLDDGDTLRLEARLVRRMIGGRPYIMYGYDGQHPGPLLQVRQGATIVVDFRNAIDQPSAVHWHGIRLENRSDGAVGVTQDPVEPGGRFTYRVHFRDAGIYWYHPHVREDVQQDLGLAGNILVAPAGRGYWNPVHREEVLLLDDLLADASGRPMPHGAEAPTHALSGRHGTLTLVNGEPRWSLTVRRGEVVRFHLTNAAGARFFNVSLGGVPLKVVGSDVGKFERETWSPNAVLAPAERYVVEARFDRAGTVPLLSRVRALDHMAGWFVSQVDTLGVVRVLDAPATPDYAASHARLRTNADAGAELSPLRGHLARPAAHALTLGVRVGEVPNAIATMLWATPAAVDWNDGMPMTNAAVTGRRVTWLLRDPATGKENMDVRWRFRLGELVRMRFWNDPLAAHAMAHPIHVHGQRFVVLSRNGVPSDNLVWKDTAIVPVGETVEVLVEMSNPGRWMLHCHIAEHLGTGMMTVFDVVE
jgi:suppressor of ftsI